MLFYKKDLPLLEYIITKYSLHFGYDVLCYLTTLYSPHSNLKFNIQSKNQLRNKLRNQLVKKIECFRSQKLSAKQKSLLLDLTHPPTIYFASISISHSVLAGGFIISSPENLIGFDLEKLERANQKIVLRVGSQNELNNSPSPSALWSAKEASYKSLYYSPFKIFINQIIIFDWKKVSSDNKIFPSTNFNVTKVKIYNYKFKIKTHPIQGKGYICILNKNIMSFSAQYKSN